MYAQFLPFKSKSFITSNALYHTKRILQRKISIKQIKKLLHDESEFFDIHNFYHREERDENGFTLPAVIYRNDDGMINELAYQSEKFNSLKSINNDLKQILSIAYSVLENGHTLPASIHSYGSWREWYKNGKLHRDDKDNNNLILPAHISTNLSYKKEWYINGEMKRTERDEDGYLLPTTEAGDGDKYWQNKNRKYHRDEKDKNGHTLPAVISKMSSGDYIPKYIGFNKFWYNNNKIHRDDKELSPNGTIVTLPAIIWNDGGQEWWYKGKRHRNDKDLITKQLLPTTIYLNKKEWWINGKRRTEENKVKLLKQKAMRK